MTKYYKKSILSMVERMDDEHFLRQIWTILIRHMEKKGGTKA